MCSELNTQLVALGSYSHETLKSMVAATGIEYQRLERGILHFFPTPADFESGAAGAELMRRYGTTPEEVLSQ